MKTEPTSTTPGSAAPLVCSFLCYGDAQPRSCHELGACQDGGAGCSGICRRAASAAFEAAQQHKQQQQQQRARRQRISPLGRLVLQAMAILVFAGVVGRLAGYLQALGWPQ